MFDLSIIENDWKNSCKALSEDEIYDIFKQEKATYEDYIRELKAWKKGKATPPPINAHSVAFGSNAFIKKVNEDIDKSDDKPEPVPRRLSENKQREVILGSMNILFDSVKGCYKAYGNKVDMETLYDICLEAFIRGVNLCTLKKGEYRRFIETCIYNNVHGYLKSLPEELEIPTNPSVIFYMTMNDSYEYELSDNISPKMKPKSLVKK